jgi:hypothetical protein
LRTRVVPLAFSTLAKLDVVHEFLFRTTSQIEINYRHCSFNAGKAGDIPITIGPADEIVDFYGSSVSIDLFGTTIRRRISLVSR